MRMRVDVRPIGTSGMVVLSEAQKRKLGPDGRIPIRSRWRRVVTPPAELEAALATVPDGRRRWDAVPWYHQREMAEYVDEAKQPQTRRRRAEKAVREHLD